MGESKPGQIADPVRLSTTTIKLLNDISGDEGDFLIPDTSDPDVYTSIPTDTVGFQPDTTNGAIQSQVDFDSSDKESGEIYIAGFDFQSRIYAYCGGELSPGEEVGLEVITVNSENLVGFVSAVPSTTNLTITNIVGSADSVAVTVASGLSSIKVGETITIHNTTNYNGTFVVSSKGTTTFTYIQEGANTTAETSGLVRAVVTPNAIARFVKVSGDNPVGKSALGDIGVFDLGAVS